MLELLFRPIHCITQEILNANFIVSIVVEKMGMDPTLTAIIVTEPPGALLFDRDQRSH